MTEDLNSTSGGEAELDADALPPLSPGEPAADAEGPFGAGPLPVAVEGGGGRRTRGRTLLAVVAGTTLLVGLGAGYVLGQRQAADLRSRLAAAQASAEGSDAHARTQVAAAEARTELCQDAATQAEEALAGWGTYLDSVQKLYAAETNRAADSALGAMARRYKAVVEAKEPTQQAIDRCTAGG